jgi:hypothetical protein
LKLLHRPILIRTTTSGRDNLASIQQSVSKLPTSPHNSYLGPGNCLPLTAPSLQPPLIPN